LRKEEPKAAEEENQEPQKIETVYQKLDGPKIVGEKIDLTQFAPKPGAGAKRKERIENLGRKQQGGNNQQGRIIITITREEVKETVMEIIIKETVKDKVDKETVHKVKVETVLETIIKERHKVKEDKVETEVVSKGGQNNRPGQRVCLLN
jgi:hypothetical protein